MWEVCNICRVNAVWIQNALWRKKNYQLDNDEDDNAIFLSGGESVWSVEFKSPWSSTLRLVPLESSDGDGDFDTLTTWASSHGGTITYCACKSASRLAFSAAAEALAFKGPDPSARPFPFRSPEISCIQSWHIHLNQRTESWHLNCWTSGKCPIRLWRRLM